MIIQPKTKANTLISEVNILTFKCFLCLVKTQKLIANHIYTPLVKLFSSTFDRSLLSEPCGFEVRCVFLLDWEPRDSATGISEIASLISQEAQ